MKYIGAFGLMLMCNEAISILALFLILTFVIFDILKARCER